MCTGVPAHGRERPEGGVAGVLLVDDIAGASSGGKREGDEKICAHGEWLSWLQMPWLAQSELAKMPTLAKQLGSAGVGTSLRLRL